MKFAVYLGLGIGSLLGGYLGSLVDGNAFGFWAVAGSTIGAFVGIWAGYKISKEYM